VPQPVSVFFGLPAGTKRKARANGTHRFMMRSPRLPEIRHRVLAARAVTAIARVCGRPPWWSRTTAVPPVPAGASWCGRWPRRQRRRRSRPGTNGRRRGFCSLRTRVSLVRSLLCAYREVHQRLFDGYL